MACSRQPAAHRARQEPLELDLLTASCEHDVFVRGLSTDPLNSVDFQARLENCEKLLSVASCLSVRPSSWNNSAPTGRIFMKCYF